MADHVHHHRRTHVTPVHRAHLPARPRETPIVKQAWEPLGRFASETVVSSWCLGLAWRWTSRPSILYTWCLWLIIEAWFSCVYCYDHISYKAYSGSYLQVDLDGRVLLLGVGALHLVHHLHHPHNQHRAMSV